MAKTSMSDAANMPPKDRGGDIPKRKFGSTGCGDEGNGPSMNIARAVRPTGYGYQLSTEWNDFAARPPFGQQRW